MADEEPNLVASPKSQRVMIDGYDFSIAIYRLEQDKTWTLEVVDFEGASYVWDEQFASDKEARNAALQELDKLGALAFMRGDNVIPFSRE